MVEPSGASQGQDIEVRPPLADDFISWRRLYRGYAAFYRAPMTGAILDRTWGWLRDTAHPLEGLVAAIDGELAGFAHFRAYPKPLLGKDAGFLDDLFVDPSRRGLGIGRHLIARVAEAARERGWPSVRWITAADNETARRLYDDVAIATHWVTYELTPQPRHA